MNSTGVGGFKKGQSGNPAGRKPRAVEEDFKAMIDACISSEDWQNILIAAKNEARGRGPAAQRAREWLAERRYGKVKDQLELSGEVEALVWDRPVPNSSNTQ